MKVVIPLAGKGTRLRPHTYTTPKPLVHVGGRPVMSYILDDLRELGVEEVVFITGYLGDRIEDYIEGEYPEFTAHYVEQEVQDGTAGAVKLAEPFIDEDLLVIFVDTLFDADLSIVRDLAEDEAGVIWAKEVEDYQRFGVIVTDDDGYMERIVEKPQEPISKLANIGLYYIRDWEMLFEGIDETLGSTLGPGGEYYLTDAFQYMIDHGARIRTAEVAGWYDCGKPETLIETNRHLLETTRGRRPDGGTDCRCEDPLRVEPGVTLREARVGPNVTIEEGTSVHRSVLRDCIIGGGAVIEDCELHDSIIGDRAVLRGVRGSVSVAPDSVVEGDAGGAPGPDGGR
ncbi:MAG: NTP transferase domain-containing protein [Gemmatimonadetes bacterium]|nr:NTP transferase domain-containing protein [Gemmatimonadota bacterium]NIQ59588.1 NTP transferase domain-containing protein [Gemmatimonadota bacterium]NIU79794.1 NTP transferase domain-containing protein [Gammaproteobacteria bacterium]NIX48298.1 NTP transferase domain-containing protein [Gemmatimonadota bacterium]NIY12743.1 NTP transferase domain-containing protein [Gemmatimonadota bacterium]